MPTRSPGTLVYSGARNGQKLDSGIGRTMPIRALGEIAMDFNADQMILAHSRWKTRLKAAIEKKEPIESRLAGRDDQCELGKWLANEGKKYAHLSEYVTLKRLHAKFHSTIPEVVAQARISPAHALELLSSSGAFGRASADCINAIVALRQSTTVLNSR